MEARTSQNHADWLKEIVQSPPFWSSKAALVSKKQSNKKYWEAQTKGLTDTFTAHTREKS